MSNTWLYSQQVTLDFIELGKPAQNCYLELCNGKFLDECLNVHWFVGLSHACQIIHT